MPVHVADASEKPVGMDSVIVVGVEVAVSVLDVPKTAVPETVVMIVSEPKPLLPLNVKGPTPPFDILRKATLAGVSLLVMVQVAD
jgi:hypothetical protein